MCFPCCPASGLANLCPLASMCLYIVHLRPCLLSVRMFIYDSACLVFATYVHTCVMPLFFNFFFTMLLNHCVPFVNEVSS